MSDRLNAVLSGWLEGDQALEAWIQRAEALQWILNAEALEISGILRFLESVPPEISDTQRRFLDRVLNLLAIRLRKFDELDEADLDRIVSAHQKWGATHRMDHLLLALLASLGSEPALKRFAELVVQQPPANSNAATIAFVPLLRQDDIATETLFPKLLEALSHLSVASLVLDLANQMVRRGDIERHPAADRVEALGELFAGLVARLGKFENEPPTEVKDFVAAKVAVTEATSIALAICDAFTLIGDQKAVGKLKSALDLKHRKLRSEAAISLAKLGNEEGKELLVELAAEPVCRQRVLATAEELDLLPKIAAEYQTEQAKVEGELAAWLSLDTQFGMPPHEIHQIDTRTLGWPGFEDPIECHLVQYAFHMPGGTFQSVGIVGPATQSFAVDLAPLGLADVYAAFAGWQAEHPEVFELEPEQWQPNQLELVNNLRQRIEGEGYESPQPAMLGFFFGDIRLIAATKREGQPGTAVADLRNTTFYPAGESRHPIGPREAYYVHVGREYMQAFNKDRPEWVSLNESLSEEEGQSPPEAS
ncbi:HEAT repeat domain-containing protein [Bremerella sp. JC817]|uniref:HEAT repeat domain-containing protein n=1 Tax=Bremerella sp. JC817 TaxID=3231756 RepID=UPI003457D5F6